MLKNVAKAPEGKKAKSQGIDKLLNPVISGIRICAPASLTMLLEIIGPGGR